MTVSFAFPELAAFLIMAAVTMTLLVAAEKKRRKRLASLFSQNHIERVFPEHQKLRQPTKILWQWVALFFLCLAIMGPQWGVDLTEVETLGEDLIIVLDVSRSMDTQDVSPSRLIRSKREIAELLDNLLGERIGLVVFTGRSYLQCPLTEDRGAIRLFLDGLSTDMFPNQGSTLDGLPELIDEIYDTESKAQLRDKNLLLVSDGELHDNFPKDFVDALKSRNIRVFAVTVGTETGGPVIGENGAYVKDANGHIVISKSSGAKLQDLAESTMGGFHNLGAQPGDLARFYVQAKSAIQSQKVGRNRQIQQPKQRFQWFLGLALLFCFGELALAPRIRKK